MGKPTGFLDYPRADCPSRPAAERVGDFEEFHRSLPPVERRQQGGRCMDCGLPFCQSGIVFQGIRLGCPLHNLIPEWNHQLWLGRWDEALERLTMTNCFPEFTGRVCPGLCQHGCALGRIGDSVTVRENELAIIEHAFAAGRMTPQVPETRSGYTVAVVGSGPAGLSAAYWLNRRGHSVTVFERDDKPGGLLRYGIPNMKLPKDILDRRVDLMEQEGVTFRTGLTVGEALEPSQLVRDFDSTVFCCGAQSPRPLSWEGAANGVGYALDYLRSPSGPLNAAGKTVAVVGAGDSASDCIATALRQGARDVVQLIRRPESDYAGQPEDYAHQEASALFGRDIRRFETKVLSVAADQNGDLQALMTAAPEGEETLCAQRLIIASGFAGTDAGFVPPEGPNVFTAGDMRIGPSLVVLALAEGRQAARQVEAYLLETGSV